MAESIQPMEQLIRDFVESSAKVVQSDHDLLTKLAEAVMGEGTGLISIAKDHEKRLRWAETRLYIAVGALGLVELAVGVLTLLKK